MTALDARPLVPLAAAAVLLVGAVALASASVEDAPLALLGLAVLIAIAGVWRVSHGDLRPVRLSLLAGGLAISGAALVNVIVATDPSVFALNIAAAPAAALVACWIASGERGRRVVVAGAAAGLAVLGLAALALYAGGGETGVGVQLEGDEVTRRIFPASFGHPNQFATTLGVLLPLVFAYAIGPARGWARVLLATSALLGLTALALTYSRNFWIAVALALVVVCLTSRVGLALLATGVVAVAVLSPRIVDRFSEADLSGGRLEIWERSLTLIREHPLTGVGVEAFPTSSGAVTLPRTADAPPHAHNLLLTTASELGVVAAAGLAVVLLTLLVALTRRVLRERGEPRAIASGCLGAIIVMLVGGAFDAVVYHNVPTLMVAAMMIGVAAAVTARPLPARRARAR